MIPVRITHSAGTHTVEYQVQYFENRFGDLVNKACREVKKIDLHILFSRVTYLPVSVRRQHQSFIEEKLTNIPPPETFAKIWSILNLYWDFLNYGLLEHVINQCGSEDLKQQMQNYILELSVFKQTTRLCDFIESWPCRDDGPPEDQLKKVVVKMNHEWSQCTLKDVESFKKALVHKFTTYLGGTTPKSSYPRSSSEGGLDPLVWYDPATPAVSETYGCMDEIPPR